MEGKPLFRPLKIGPVILPGNILSAPLAGFSDRAHRETAIRFGAACALTEMVSAEALVRGSAKTLDLARPAENEVYPAIQIFTGSPETAAGACRLLAPLKPAFVDLNCGCPVPKVLKTGGGSALMGDPEMIGRIVAAMKGVLSCPVTVKIRSGLRSDSLTWREAALAAQEAGASLVTLHPRTAKQGYSGRADWALLAGLKDLLTVPVLGSGDLFTAEDVMKMLTETGIDGVMIARGGIGNPFIYKQTEELLVSGTVTTRPTPQERMAAALEHLERAFYYDPAPLAAREMRKHLCAYTKGLPHSAPVRAALVHGTSLDEYRLIFTDWFGNDNPSVL
jgi:nifR3 family TIM-barrel protein